MLTYQDLSSMKVIMKNIICLIQVGDAHVRVVMTNMWLQFFTKVTYFKYR
jgi:hypothetical protein